MESRRSKSTESIWRHIYNISPIHASFLLVLASPDTELPSKIAPRAHNLETHFLHQHMAQSTHKNSVEQRSVSSETYQNLSPIHQFLPGTVGPPTCSLSGEAGDYRYPSCTTDYRWNLTVPNAQNPSTHYSTISSRSLWPVYLVWPVLIQR